MRFFAPLLLAASVADAHYTFSALIDGGTNSGDWVAVRKTVNWQNNGPVTDVTSDDIRCFELSPGTGAAQTVNVTAGSSIAFQANPDIYHPGPLAFYMAKAPAGQTAATFDGSGAVWFKIYEEQPNFGGQALTWSSNGLKTPSVTIPKCLPDGDYLLRIEHIGLHVAQSAGGAQFYISCGQVTLSGGGSGSPSDLVAFPGAYKATDPGILININYPVPTSYTNPGPAVFTC
ncbi:hypothetical protein SEUCBS139899_003488 [Sporothrix eucalyptigena]|uniref:lytic cellulose monooxygenase (C4-dehydrogenating) n=1 Tax=Sporothrix eucalyptigena TaxID=1812306 RepID=A0ABP0APF7_9PEZI